MISRRERHAAHRRLAAEGRLHGDAPAIPRAPRLTYLWDFGVTGGATATTKDASYTYTQRGLYTATLTVKDADGRTATRTFSVEVLGTCPGTDLFTGTTLDRTVWPTIVREDAPNYKVENGLLKINADRR